MARWEPDASGRLVKAALELFAERGYAETTVADIAARAGLTERTFFRYFTDKREVLFSGSKELEQLIVETVQKAAPGAPPLEVVADAVVAAAAHLQVIRDGDAVRFRWSLVTQHAELRERELIKMASLVDAVARALRDRGVPEPAASLAAETGITLFKVGFARWVGEKRPRDFPGHVRAALVALRSVAAGDKPGRTTEQKVRASARRN